MGGMISKQKKEDTNNLKSLSNIVDVIASDYIIKQNFQDMIHLSEMKYCNNLVILTSKIIEENLNEKEIEYMAQRVKNGETVNEMTKENVIYLDKEFLDDLDVKNKTRKQKMCIAISKFYIRIAHIFAAILTTINPKYVYQNSAGKNESVGLLHKDALPEGAVPTIDRINICTKRQNALINNKDYDAQSSAVRVIKPRFCDINQNRDTGETFMLVNEPGIPELAELYNDNWDPIEGEFIGMTENTRKNVYQKDVEKFYKAFTGEKQIPLDENGKPKITSFSQIPLRDFHRSEGCQRDGAFTKKYEGSSGNKLFTDYANNIKQMMQTTTNNQNKLLVIIDKLFTYAVDPYTKEQIIVINPTLKEGSLQVITDEARKLIINLYITCETDFMKGMHIFEAIVEKKIIDSSQSQIENLEGNIEGMHASALPPDMNSGPPPPYEEHQLPPGEAMETEGDVSEQGRSEQFGSEQNRSEQSKEEPDELEEVDIVDPEGTGKEEVEVTTDIIPKKQESREDIISTTPAEFQNWKKQEDEKEKEIIEETDTMDKEELVHLAQKLLRKAENIKAE